MFLSLGLHIRTVHQGEDTRRAELHLTFPTAKGGVNTSSARLRFCGPTVLHAPNSLVGFASSSPVALMRRLIRRWTVFPATCQNSTLRSTFGAASYRQLAGSGTFL
jgi:hypothetical protein